MPEIILPSFAKGEVGPSLYGRVDTALYRIGLKTARNVNIHPYGGVSNRPGTRMVGPCKQHGADPRLIPFQFNTEDAYMLEFGDGYMRVIRDGGYVLEPGIAITGITAANPPVVSSAGHGFLAGEQIYITGVVGMTRVNANYYLVGNPSGTTLELKHQVTNVDIDGSAFPAYSSGGTMSRVYTLATPYAQADLPLLKFNQSGDVMTLTLRGYDTLELSRLDHDNWTLTEPTFSPTVATPTGVAVTADTTGAVTERYRVTAVAAETFEESLPGLHATPETIISATQANPVVLGITSTALANGDEIEVSGVQGMTELNGRRFIIANKTTNSVELQGVDGTGYTPYITGGTATRTFVQITNGATPNDNTVTWAAVAGAVRYTVYRRENGVYGYLGETELTTFKDANIEANLTVSPPAARTPFLDTNNQPGASGYHEQRRVFGGSIANPDTSYYTQTGNQSNLSVSTPLQDDDAITAALPSREVNEIRHYVPLSDLVVMTSGGEWRVNAGGDGVFSSATIKQRLQSQWGTSHHRPAVVGDTILFATPDSTMVRTLGYSFQKDGYTGSNLTISAPHLYEIETIKDMAYARYPEGRLHLIRTDGEMQALTLDQEQEVVAWSHWDTLGEYRQVGTVFNTSTQDGDDIYVVAKRRITGNTVRYVERVASRRFRDVRDCYFVDCGLSLDIPIAITNVTAADPVVVTAAAHGLTNGDEVDLSDIKWVSDFDDVFNETQPDQLNNERYVVAGATTNTFQLNDEDGNTIDGTAFNAYVSGGYVRKVVNTISGFDHLEGETLVGLLDGNVASGLTVTNGSITLPYGVSRAHIGLRYISDVALLDIEASQGTIQGKLKSIPRVTLRFLKSRGLWIGPDHLNMTEVPWGEIEDLNDPLALLTGDVEQVVEQHWSTKGSLFMRQFDPIPFTLLAAVPTIEIEANG